jgi:hypothetical protein
LATLTLAMSATPRKPSGAAQRKMRDLFRVAQKDAMFYETGGVTCR